MSSHLAVHATHEILSRRRALQLLVLDQVRIEAWDRLLFVECGDGCVAEEAWRRAPRAYACGLDMWPAHVKLARQLREVPGKLEFKTWDGRRLPLADWGFDRVVATFALTQFQDPAGVLREVYRVVRPEGDVYVLEADRPDRDLRATLERVGFAAVRDLTRSETALLIHACAAVPARSASRGPGTS